MKIKLSRKQWENAGKEAGWMTKEASLTYANLQAFKKFILPNLQGILTNYTVRPDALGISEEDAQKISSLANQLIVEIDKLGNDKSPAEVQMPAVKVPAVDAAEYGDGGEYSTLKPTFVAK